MTGASYVPGTWLGILRSRTAVLLGPDTPQATAGAVWELLGSKPAVHEVLHAVTGSSGGSLTRIPPFAILDFSGPLRVFLRGDLDLAVELPDGRVELDGRDVTTWNERRFALPGACRISIPGAGSGNQPELPLREGVVLLQSLALMPGASQPELEPAVAPPVAAVVVDSAGIADVQDAEPWADEPADVTIAPDHGASAETVLGVLDGDVQAETEDDVQGEATDPGTDSGPGSAAPGDSTALTSRVSEFLPAESTLAASDQTSSYDHLWERTVIRSIEDAAVRDDDETDMGQAGVAGTSGAAAEVEEQAPLPVVGQADGKENTTPAAAPPASAAAAASRPAPAAPGGVLIDSVPWKKGAGTAAPRDIAAPEPAPEPDSAGSTAAAPAPAGAQPRTGSVIPPAANAAFDTDHDGQTVMKSSIKAPAGPAAAMAPGDTSAGPTVLARVCSQGHANPPTRPQCAACGAALHPDAVQVPRPRLGRVRLSTGDLLDLDQSLVIGRQPSVSRVQGGIMPRLVQVPSPEGDISRSHVEVRLEGWHVMLCDLKATNGTVLVREGQPPRRLAQNEMAILLDGDIAELGDNISLRFEEIP
jgi:FHA domain